MNILSIFGSHNAAISVCVKGEIVEVIEIERFINSKNASLSFYIIHDNKESIVRLIISYIEEKYQIFTWDLCLHQRAEGLIYLISANQFIETNHHESHAAGSFYQSDFEEATIISYDGGGNDGLFNIYEGHKNEGVTLIEKIDFDLGVPYSLLGHFMSPIRKEENILVGNIVYPGKIMGLSAYGNIVDNWIEPLTDYYYSQPRFDDYVSKCNDLFKKLDLQLNNGSLNTIFSTNLAATSQFVFESIFFEKTSKYLKAKPIIVTGGCALNILLNTKIVQRNPDVYIAPNSSDCGISCGMILGVLKPKDPVDLTYLGTPVLDKWLLPEYVSLYNGKEVERITLSNQISKGKIVGVLRGGAEHGPRALGNRSILCNPMYQDMKKVLNVKVKNREYYRPFAPVCTYEDAHKYFEFYGDTRYMSFAAKVKEEYRTVFKSITHVDGTCRLQTVKLEQNEFLYKLLKSFEKKSGYPVLLNTSFNIAGKPMLNSYRDAVWMLENTGLDILVLENYTITK